MTEQTSYAWRSDVVPREAFIDWLDDSSLGHPDLRVLTPHMGYNPDRVGPQRLLDAYDHKHHDCDERKPDGRNAQARDAATCLWL
jgi:hypothetical protein